MDIIMALFSIFEHTHTSRNGKIKNTMGQFSENIGTKWTGFIRQRTGLIRRRTKPVHLVLIFSLNLPLVFLISPFLHVLSCPKTENNAIMMSINCFFFQDRHSEIMKYTFNCLITTLHLLHQVCFIPI